MTGEERRNTVWQQTRKLNQTPLSQACMKLLKDPWEGELYLLQALKQALEEDQPDWTSSLERRAQTVWRNTNSLLEEMGWRLLPETAYRLLTTNEDLEEDEMNDGVILELMEREPEDPLFRLLDEAASNLESNGFDLDGIAPTRD